MFSFRRITCRMCISHTIGWLNKVTVIMTQCNVNWAFCVLGMSIMFITMLGMFILSIQYMLGVTPLSMDLNLFKQYRLHLHKDILSQIALSPTIQYEPMPAILKHTEQICYMKRTDLMKGTSIHMSLYQYLPWLVSHFITQESHTSWCWCNCFRCAVWCDTIHA